MTPSPHTALESPPSRAVRKGFKPTRLHWAVLVANALYVPAFILYFRLKVMCPVLGQKAFDFLPLFWNRSGCVPHPFCRIMHNLTHPLFLLAYALAFSYLAFRPIRRPEKASPFLLWGLLFFHFIFFFSYLFTLFLPIRMITIISPP
jgi:hypothetical protein